MVKEIKFKVEVSSEEDFQKVDELMRVQLANLELTRILKIKPKEEPIEQE